MDAVTFTSLSCSPQLESSLVTWPKEPYQLERYSNTIDVGIQSNEDLKCNASFRVISNHSMAILVINIPAWVYKLLKTVLKDTRYVYTKTCTQSANEFGKTQKAVSLLTFKRFIRRPAYVIVCNGTSNFYCCYMLKRLMKTLFKEKQKTPNASHDHLLQICKREISMDETFEHQYYDDHSILSFHHTQSEINEYTLQSQNDFENIDSVVKQNEYMLFIESERTKTYPETNDGSLDYIRGILIKNKIFVYDYEKMMYALNIAISIVDKQTSTLLQDETIKELHNAKQQLEKKASELKCCLCVTNWQNCLLSTCFHLSMCRSCTITNREYNRYSCPICRTLSPFIITDLDL